MGRLIAVVMGLVFLGGIAVPSHGAESAPPKKIASIEGITEYELENGLKVLLFPDQSRPTVTVNMTVFVGSRHEGYGETGMAHLLEHMVFKGTPTHPKIPKALQERGAQFNGTTSFDRTNYFETMPANDSNLEFGIHLEADRLVNSYVKREDLVSEFTVVRSEFEMGENSPARVLNQRLMATAYEWHNYGKSTIGNRSDIERVPIENLQAFYRKFYQPDNAMVVIAGKFDDAKALEFVQKHFGAIPRPQRKLDKTYTEEPAQDGDRVVTLRRVGDVGLVGVVYHCPAGSHPEFAAVDVLGQILSSAPSGRLYQALVATRKAASVSGGAEGLHDPGVFEFTATLPKAGSISEVQNILLKTIEQFAEQGVTDEEVVRAKAQLLKPYTLNAPNTSQVAVGLSNWASQGDWRLYFIHRDRLEKVTPAEVKAAAAKYLHQSNRTLGVFIPTEKPERVAIPGTPDLKTLVRDYKGREKLTEGEAFDVTAANLEARIKRAELPEGIKVAMLPKKNRGELVNLTLTLRYGNDENLKDLDAAGGFLVPLMLRGTKGMTYQQLQDEMDRLKATLGMGGMMMGRRGGGGGGMMGGGAGAATFSIAAKRDTLPQVLKILHQVLREPTLPLEEFERLKTSRLAAIEGMKSDPNALAGKFVSRQLSPYPKGDIRYVPTIEEDIERIKSVTHEQVQKLYKEYLGSQAGELVIVGDFDPDECMSILRQTLSGWDAPKPYARIDRKPRLDGLGVKEAINTPDKANAIYMASLPLPISDSDPDYPALVMGNFILGGGSLSSRLGDRVRQKEGLSYTVASMFSAPATEKNGRLNIFAISNPANTPKVEKVIAEELNLFLKDGVTEDELAKAKQGFLQSQRVQRTNDGMLAGQIGGALFDGRTMSHYVELEKKIEALTPAQVNAACRKHFDPKKLVIVTAGDFDKKSGGDNK